MFNFTINTPVGMEGVHLVRCDIIIPVYISSVVNYTGFTGEVLTLYV